MSNKAYCLSMCPQSEVIFRRKNGLVHLLETLHGLLAFTNVRSGFKRFDGMSIQILCGIWKE